ncbi:MAG: DUF5808 domain-containing protein [Clostridium perfringens]|nr:DUF5808 domain-containing protein [Clostridium perfringens]
MFFGVKFPKLDEIQDIFKKYKRLFTIYFVVSWIVVNAFIIGINIFIGEYYIPLIIILTIIIDGIIIIAIHSVINSRLKVLKHREGWQQLIYNNKTFIDKKNKLELTVDDDDYLFGIFYYKPKDSSFFVERRNGKGMTINLGNIIGKIIAVVIIAVIIIGVAASTYASISLSNATSLNLVLENENVVVSGTFGELLPYKEMTSVQYLDKVPKVEMKLDGVQVGSKYFGFYDIEGIGKAKLYIENINEPVVKIVANGYLPVYINYSRLSSTQWLYNSIVTRRNNIF